MTDQKVFTAQTEYRNSSAHPIKFVKLHPGSYFRIVREPERGIYKDNSGKIYQKDRDGFFAENISDRSGCVLLPDDMVQPLTKVRAKA